MPASATCCRAVRRVALALSPFVGGHVASADTVSLIASADNTLIESPTGNVSGGIMPFFFAGDTNQGDSNNTRRGLLRFDLTAIPPRSIIHAASLRLFMSRSAIAGPNNFSLHRMSVDWGEGTSDGDGGIGGFSTPGSATWLHRYFPNVLWSSVGGDHAAEPSATLLVAGIDSYTWTSPQLAADVQQWLAAPESNHGWMLRGLEGGLVSAKRFESREAPIIADRPTLIIQFTPPTCPADVNSDSMVGVADLLAVIDSWGPCAGCPADLNNDHFVNVTDLLAVISAWGPCP